MDPDFQQMSTERTERNGGPPLSSVGSGLESSAAGNAGVRPAGSLAVRAFQKHITGDVSRTVLRTRLLPLSFACLVGALGLAAGLFPTSYDWRLHVISALTSPDENPRGYWPASLGIMAAMLVILPFAGYVARRLPAGAPRLVRSAGGGLALGFLLMASAMAAQLAEAFIGLRWLHASLAGAGALSFIAGMFCCSACALQERRQRPGGARSLSGALVCSWLSLASVPVACLAGIGALVLLGQKAGVVWAEDLRQSFRHTPLWQLAFWEWIGTGLTYVFIALSVQLLPASCEPGRTRSAHVPKPAGSSEDPLVRG